MTSSRTAPAILAGQILHLLSLVVLLALVAWAWTALEKPFPLVFWIAVAVPIFHQIFVWLAWRLELKSSATSKWIGFSGYVAGFFIFFAGRFVSLLLLAWMDRDSLSLPVFPRVLLTAVLVFLGVYAMISVKRYFGLARASGADHFDPQYRSLPFVEKGIFRFTKNGMYVYAFLLFWAIPIGFDSSAALVVAAFSHAYIWVHYYSTEKPDMEFLYSPD